MVTGNRPPGRIPSRKDPEMLRGLTTVSFFADDLEAAKKWYSALLGTDPYFERPVGGPAAYIEFPDR